MNKRYPQELIAFVKTRFLQGDQYLEIASLVRNKFDIDNFSKSNVAGLITRLRDRGELPQTMTRPKTSITLPRIGR